MSTRILHQRDNCDPNSIWCGSNCPRVTVPTEAKGHQVIPDEAVEAAAKVLHAEENLWEETWEHATVERKQKYRTGALIALDAAAPHLLSHERQQTADAHRDATVNAQTVDRYERAIAGVLELAAPQRHMVAAHEIRAWIETALGSANV